jgi:hypothetical protein
VPFCKHEITGLIPLGSTHETALKVVGHGEVASASDVSTAVEFSPAADGAQWATAYWRHVATMFLALVPSPAARALVVCPEQR